MFTIKQEHKKRRPSATANQGRVTKRAWHSGFMEPRFFSINEEYGPGSGDRSDKKLLLDIYAGHLQQNHRARNGKTNRNRCSEQTRAESQEIEENRHDSFFQGKK
jgi:hypothetical protein